MDSKGVLSGLHVLVADDERNARETLQELLTDDGASVALAEGANEAVSALAQGNLDVVVIDMRLGSSGTGFRVLREARQLGNTAPFIAISGYDFNAEGLKDAGFAAYLPKPINADALVKTIVAVAPRTELRRG